MHRGRARRAVLLRALIPLCLAFLQGALSACAHQSQSLAAQDGAQIVREEAYSMGTHVMIVAATDDPNRAEAAMLDALAEMHRLDELMTTWEHAGWPQSDIMRLNAAAGHAPVEVAADTMRVLQAAQDMAERSGGVFDVTMGALSSLWHFDEDLDPVVPDANALNAQRALVNYKDLVLDANAQTAFLRKPNMAVNLGGIAKGYAVDAMAQVLRDAGVGNAIVQAGGDMLVMGRKPGNLFRVGIRDPRSEDVDAFFATLPITDHAFSTAGDYERYFELDEKIYHHILDPRTGYPATASRSVTVFAASAMLADALDDAIFVLGPAQGMALLAQYPGAGAVIVDAQNNVAISDNLSDAVQVHHAPTHHWHHHVSHMHHRY